MVTTEGFMKRLGMTVFIPVAIAVSFYVVRHMSLYYDGTISAQKCSTHLDQATCNSIYLDGVMNQWILPGLYLILVSCSIALLYFVVLGIYSLTYWLVKGKQPEIPSMRTMFTSLRTERLNPPTR
jgi:hypothetical protein